MMLNLDKPSGYIRNILLSVLQEHQSGLSEYELIQIIKEDILAGDTDKLFRDTHQLFIVHFIVFHHLYLLKQELAASGTATLQITPLNICLLPCSRPAGQQLQEHDPLVDYYLDMSNLHNTTQQDVDELLNSFWQYFTDTGAMASAMEVLEIDSPLNEQALTRHYRKMVMKYHPDRGGDTEKIQAINNAYRILKRCLS